MYTAFPALPASEHVRSLPVDSLPVDSDDTLEMTIVPVHVVAERRAVRIHRVIARVLLGGIALQIFFAGVGIFGVSTFLPHMILGSVVILASFALPIIAWRAHLESTVARRSWLLAGLMILQGVLIDVGRIVHVVAALHPVNAMLLVLLTYSLTHRQR